MTRVLAFVNNAEGLGSGAEMVLRDVEADLILFVVIPGGVPGTRSLPHAVLTRAKAVQTRVGVNVCDVLGTR